MVETNNLMITFGRDISIGYLDVGKTELTRLDHVDRHNDFYKNIEAPFDWYCHGNIMIIADPIASPRKNWYKEISVGGQEIECPGDFVVFFHYKEVRNTYNFASSLTLPEFEHIKCNLLID